MRVATPTASCGAQHRCAVQLGTRCPRGGRDDCRNMMPLQSTAASALAGPHSLPAFGKAGRMSVARAPLLTVAEMTFEPLILVAVLWALAWAIEGRLYPQYLVLALVVFV